MGARPSPRSPSRASRSRARALRGAIGLGALLGLGGSALLAAQPLGAWAQGAPGTSRAPATSTEACAQGNTRYQAHDLPGATALYRTAIALDPNDPVAHYLLGEAALAAGNVAEAEAEWSRASALAGERDPAARGRILFVLADLKERQWKWNEATAAWQAYADLADRYPDAGGIYPASARARLQAIAAMLKQDRAYEVVRRRIAEARDGGVVTDLSK
jgi:tetratricopeptide (TPR) repeat protein